MASNSEFDFSSFEMSFDDPPLFGHESDMFAEASPTWMTDAPLDRSLNTSQSSWNPISPPHQTADSTYGARHSFDSPFSESTSFSSACSEVAYVSEWHAFNELARYTSSSAATMPGAAAPNSYHYHPETTHVIPAISPRDVLLLHPQTAMTSSHTLATSSPDTVTANTTTTTIPPTTTPAVTTSPSPPSSQPSPRPRVPIQREQRPRFRKTSSPTSCSSSSSPPRSHAVSGSGGGSGDRVHCTVARCRSTFTRPSDLQRHLLDVHSKSGKRFQCAACLYYSRRSDKVKEHCQKMHRQTRGAEHFELVVDKA